MEIIYPTRPAPAFNNLGYNYVYGNISMFAVSIQGKGAAINIEDDWISNLTNAADVTPGWTTDALDVLGHPAPRWITDIPAGNNVISREHILNLSRSAPHHSIFREVVKHDFQGSSNEISISIGAYDTRRWLDEVKARTIYPGSSNSGTFAHSKAATVSVNVIVLDVAGNILSPQGYSVPTTADTNQFLPGASTPFDGWARLNNEYSWPNYPDYWPWPWQYANFFSTTRYTTQTPIALGLAPTIGYDSNGLAVGMGFSNRPPLAPGITSSQFNTSLGPRRWFTEWSDPAWLTQNINMLFNVPVGEVRVTYTVDTQQITSRPLGSSSPAPNWVPPEVYLPGLAPVSIFNKSPMRAAGTPTVYNGVEEYTI